MGGAISGPSSMHANNRPPTWRPHLWEALHTVRIILILYDIAIQFGFKERKYHIIPYNTMISHACKGSEDRILFFCCHKTISQSSRRGGYLSRYSSVAGLQSLLLLFIAISWDGQHDCYGGWSSSLQYSSHPRTNGRKVHLGPADPAGSEEREDEGR